MLVLEGVAILFEPCNRKHAVHKLRMIPGDKDSLFVLGKLHLHRGNAGVDI